MQKKNIKYVTDNDLCLSCGFCEPACPENAIKISFNKEKGFHEPTIDENKCDNHGKCYEVCPGAAVDFPELNKIRNGEIPEYHHIGIIKDSNVFYSNDIEVRKKAASGGFITSLIKYLFDAGKIQGAIVVKNSYDTPFEPTGYIAKNFEELLKSQMSIYHTVPMGKVMKEVETFDGKLIIVGIPCQIHGLLKYTTVFSGINEKIFAIIGTFCGGYQTHFAHQYFFPKNDIEFDEIKSVDYRYGEFPGQFYVGLKEKEGLELKRRFNNNKKKNEYNVAFNSSFYVPRCYICADKGNIFADITAGDPWLPKFKDEKLGKSLVVTRTDLGKEIIDEAIEAKYITREDATFKDVMDVQKLDRERHGNQLANRKLFRLLGKPYPEYSFLGKAKIFRKGIYIRVVLDYLRPIIQRRKWLWPTLRPIYFVEKNIRNIFIYENPVSFLKKRLKKK